MGLKSESEMTTEEEYQRHLDTQPSDWEARMQFADWLDASRDPRGPGYRALGVQKRRPHESDREGAWWWTCTSPDPNDIVLSNDLWEDWFLLLPAGEGDDIFWPLRTVNGGIRTRRECEDAAAIAFTELPPERQVELLMPRTTR